MGGDIIHIKDVTPCDALNCEGSILVRLVFGILWTVFLSGIKCTILNESDESIQDIHFCMVPNHKYSSQSENELLLLQPLSPGDFVLALLVIQRISVHTFGLGH